MNTYVLYFNKNDTENSAIQSNSCSWQTASNDENRIQFFSIKIPSVDMYILFLSITTVKSLHQAHHQELSYYPISDWPAIFSLYGKNFD